MIADVLQENALLVAFVVIGATMGVASILSRTLTGGRVSGSAIAILIGLGLAFYGGLRTGGAKGLADVPLLSGIGLMGGAMLRDFAIVATAFEVDVSRARRAGAIGALALVLGTILPFIVGVVVAYPRSWRQALAVAPRRAAARQLGPQYRADDHDRQR